MTSFDRTITLAASPEAIIRAIHSTASEDQFKVLQPGKLLIALRGQWGLVYILQPESDFTTRLRLLVDSAENVRTAFEGKSAREALLTLLKLPLDSTGTLAEKAIQHLEKLVQAVVPADELRRIDAFSTGVSPARTTAAQQAYTASKRRQSSPQIGLGWWLALIACVIGVTFVILFGATSGWFDFIGHVLTAEPQHFENEDLTFTYPGNWRPYDLKAQIPECRSVPLFECLIGIQNFGRTTALFIGKVVAEEVEGLSSNDVTRFGRELLEAMSFTIISSDELEIDGNRAFRYYVTGMIEQQSAYVEQIFIVRGDTFYIISTGAPSETVFDQDRDTIEAIITSIDFQ